MEKSEPLHLVCISVTKKLLYCEQQADLMVSGLNSALKGVSSRSGKGHCVVFFGRILLISPPMPLSIQKCIK